MLRNGFVWFFCGHNIWAILLCVFDVHVSVELYIIYSSIFQTRSRSTSGYCVLKNESNGRRCVKPHVLSVSTLLLCFINWAMRNLAHSQQSDIMWPSESESGGERQFAASFSWEFFIHSRVKPAHTGIPYRTLLSISARFPFHGDFLK
jgi:hypothetical protein